MPSQFASSVDMGHASMDHVSRRGFARRAAACFFSRGKRGQSKASGEILANRMQRSNFISPIYGSTIICFPHMTRVFAEDPITIGFASKDYSDYPNRIGLKLLATTQIKKKMVLKLK